MTNNEKSAHAVAYDGTAKLRDTVAGRQKIYVAAKADYEAANMEFQDVYDELYEAELNKLGGK